MADKSEPSPTVRNLHTTMVGKLRELFPVPGEDWDSICNQVEMLALLSAYDLGKVKSMDELFIKLMMSDANKITYGKYEDILNIFQQKHVVAGQIILRYSKLIKEAQKAERKRHTSRDSDTETIDEGRKQTRSRGKRNISRDSNSDTDDEEHRPSRSRRKRKSSRDSSPETADEERRLSGTRRDAGNYRKDRDDTHSAKIVYAWQKAMDAVGFIEGPAYSGTGFRVGKDKIMTAYHVVEDITKPYKGKEYNLSNLRKDSVSIKFKFLENNGSDNTRKFYFEKLCVHNKEMDFAILQLSHKDNAESSYPKAITRFKSVPTDPDQSDQTDETFTLLGHPSGKPMQIDPTVHIFDPKGKRGENRLREMEEWWRKKGKRVARKEILDTNRVLFDCWVQHGASGSPGIEMDSDGEPVCSLMLLCGYPGSALDGTYTIKKEDHPHMIEQGVTMEAIAEYLGKGDEEELKQEIFAENSFK